MNKKDKRVQKAAASDETLSLMLLIDAGKVMARALEKSLLPMDLCVSHQRILSHLYFCEGDMRLTTLRDLLPHELTGISGLLNSLEDRGLVMRHYDRSDRRVVWLNLTSEGREIAAEAIEIGANLSREVASCLQDTAVHDVMAVVARVSQIDAA